MRRPSAGVVTAACLIGLIGGLQQPFGLALSEILVIGTIVTTVLYAWAGWAPALIHLAASTASAGLFLGAPVGAAALALIGIPSGLIIALTRRKAPFFTRLKAGVLAQLALFALLITAVYLLTRRDIADVAVIFLKGMIESLGAPMRAMVLQQYAMLGAFEETTASAILAGSVGEADQLELLYNVADRLGEALRLALPSMLVYSGITTGVFAALFPAWIGARHGDEAPYVPLENWFIPRSVFFGALAALLTALVMRWVGLSGAEPVLGAVLAAVEVMLCVAGAAAACRGFKASGRSPGFRAAMIILVWLFVRRVLAIIGAASLLFGRKGVISEFIKKKANDHKGDDDL